jgi:hypothetical protein
LLDCGVGREGDEGGERLVGFSLNVRMPPTIKRSKVNRPKRLAPISAKMPPIIINTPPFFLPMAPPTIPIMPAMKLTINKYSTPEEEEAELKLNAIYAVPIIKSMSPTINAIIPPNMANTKLGRIW